MTPVFLTSTYVQDGVARPRHGHEYARVTNPTRTAMEANLASLEGGGHGVAARNHVGDDDDGDERANEGDDENADHP